MDPRENQYVYADPSQLVQPTDVVFVTPQVAPVAAVQPVQIAPIAYEKPYTIQEDIVNTNSRVALAETEDRDYCCGLSRRACCCCLGLLIVALLAAAGGVVAWMLLKRPDLTGDCHPNPCWNGADCYSDDYGVSCNCNPGWMGKYCDKPTQADHYIQGRATVLQWAWDPLLQQHDSATFLQYERQFCTGVNDALSPLATNLECQVHHFTSDHMSRVVVDYEVAIDRHGDHAYVDDAFRLQAMSSITCGIVLYSVDQNSVYFRAMNGELVKFHVCGEYGRECRAVQLDTQHIYYTCVCPSPLQLSMDGFTCIDTNECMQNNGGCEQVCTNSAGSYQCDCKQGYRLSGDGYTCIDYDECTYGHTASGVDICGSKANSVCTNVVGSYVCTCVSGYTDDFRGQCLDVDECQDPSSCRYHVNSMCVNEPGTYRCDCTLGYARDGRGECVVEIPAINRAIGRETGQSSTMYNYDSALAVDGGSSTYIDQGSCTLTQNEPNPYWWVRLDVPIDVWAIEITNRGDCCNERFNMIEMRVGMSDKEHGDDYLCARFEGMLGAGEIRKFECSVPVFGDRIMVIRTDPVGPGGDDPLTLCEVAVYGNDVCSYLTPCANDIRSRCKNVPGGHICECLPGYGRDNNGLCNVQINRAMHGTASQSSDRYNFYLANAAIDGIINPDIAEGHCAFTDYEPTPWWRLTLDSPIRVVGVEIFNRADCCHERLNYLDITVGSDGQEPNIASNSQCGYFIGDIPAGGSQLIECPTPGIYGRYVTIQRTQQIPGDQDAPLVLCEVKVYGIDYCRDMRGCTNDPYATCVNRENDYECVCEPGYSLTPSGVCVRDETLFPGICSRDIPCAADPNAVCVDIVNGYRCDCRLGFAREDGAILCSLQPYSLNRASGMPAYQSSDNIQPYQPAFLAVDGDASGPTCSLTSFEMYPWWKVELDQPIIVTAVEVVNRADCCNDRFRDIEIRVGNYDDHTMNNLCTLFTTYLGLAETRRLPCDNTNGVFGKYISVSRSSQISATNNIDLSICEFRVYGSDVCSDSRPCIDPNSMCKNTPSGSICECIPGYRRYPGSSDCVYYVPHYNRALDGDASQSSTAFGKEAPLGIDDDASANMADGTMFFTACEARPWWRVRLPKLTLVSAVEVVNRRDCCNERFDEIEIRAGYDLVSFTNPLCDYFSGTLALGETKMFHCSYYIEALTVTLQRVNDIVEKDASLHLAEVRVFGEVNHAYGMWSDQSSDASASNIAAKAVDGTFMCAITANEPAPWWRVRITAMDVTGVEILNRADCCAGDLDKFQVRVGLNEDWTTNQLCYFHDQGYIMAGERRRFWCDETIFGHYVTIQRNQQLDHKFNAPLALCEVTVIGENYCSDLDPCRDDPLAICVNKPRGFECACPSGHQKDSTGACVPEVNWAIVGSASQSCTMPGTDGEADRAIDANDYIASGPNFGDLSCAQTCEGTDNFWYVDLDRSIDVTAVNLILAPGTALSEVDVRVGNDATFQNNALCVRIQFNDAPVMRYECGRSIAGEYVSLHRVSSTPGSLLLCEVQVFGELNLAYNRPTTQSSNFSPTTHLSGRAVDGDHGTILNSGADTCSQTNYEFSPFWQVELASSSTVYSIEVVNVEDCCHTHFGNIRISVGDSPQTMETCVEFEGGLGRGERRRFMCDSAIMGRYVRIQRVSPIQGIDNANLILCEVRVFGSDSCGDVINPCGDDPNVICTNTKYGYECDCPPTYTRDWNPNKSYFTCNQFNFAEASTVGMSTTQVDSSATGKYDASNAIDGNLDGITANGYCAMTDSENNPWIRLVLPREIEVLEVEIANRVDSNWEELNNFEVRVGTNNVDFSQNYLCYYFTTGLGPGQVTSLPCGNAIYGDTVTIQRVAPINGVPTTPLTVCEIKVRGRDACTHDAVCLDDPNAMCKNLPDGKTRCECIPGYSVGVSGNCVSEVNYAFGQTTEQPCTATGSPATNAVDGLYGTRDGATGAELSFTGVCQHTCRMDRPWWKVKLDHSIHVTAVSVFNRNNINSAIYTRFDLIDIRVGHEWHDFHLNDLCYYFNDVLGAGEGRRFYCPSPIAGNVVSLARVGELPEVDAPLHVCEVEVYGNEYCSEDYDPCAHPNEVCKNVRDSYEFTCLCREGYSRDAIGDCRKQINYALTGRTEQSSTAYGAVSERGVDGNADGVFPNSYSFLTGRELMPWWKVTLDADEVHVSHIEITNFEDCCKERFNYVEFRVGHHDYFPDNTLCHYFDDGDMDYGESRNFNCETPGGFGRIPGHVVSLQRIHPVVEDMANFGAAEVRIYGEVNRAIGRPVEQSSTCQGGAAERAVDGDANPDYSANTCTYTCDGETDPWWKVTLDNTKEVYAVGLVNRDTFTERLANFEIRVGADSLIYTNNAVCATSGGGIPAGTTVTLDCTDPLMGDVVTIQRTSDISGSNPPLTMCEVYVFANDPCDDLNVCPGDNFACVNLPGNGYRCDCAPGYYHDMTGYCSLKLNYAKEKPAFQSCPGGTAYPAGLAVDETLNLPGMTCSETCGQQTPFWYVDLGYTLEVHEVAVYVIDTEKVRFSNIEIRVGHDSAFLNNDLCAVVNPPPPPGSDPVVYPCTTPMYGRFVSIQRFAQITSEVDAPLVLCEVHVYGTLNRAYGQIADEFDPDLPASLGVDGNTDNDLIVGGSCFSTGLGSAPWWRVELDMPIDVYALVITNRGDNPTVQFDQIEMRVGLSEDWLENGVCHYQDELVPPGATRTYYCHGGLFGKYVTIQRAYNPTYLANEPLQLCEVAVLGRNTCVDKKPCGNDPYSVCYNKPYGYICSCAEGYAMLGNQMCNPEVNLAPSGAADMSSTDFWPAWRAIDQNDNSDLNSGSCISTQLEPEPWWRLVLGQTYSVMSVEITNRGDCCSSLFSQIEIRVGNDPDFQNNELCYYFSGQHQPMGPGETRRFTCDTPLEGNVITVQKVKKSIYDSDSYLYLCEVKVFANDIPGGIAP